MYEQVENPKETKSRAVANSVTQKKNNERQGFGLINSRQPIIQLMPSGAIGHKYLGDILSQPNFKENRRISYEEFVERKETSWKDTTESLRKPLHNLIGGDIGNKSLANITDIMNEDVKDNQVAEYKKNWMQSLTIAASAVKDGVLSEVGKGLQMGSSLGYVGVSQKNPGVTAAVNVQPGKDVTGVLGIGVSATTVFNTPASLESTIIHEARHVIDIIENMTRDGVQGGKIELVMLEGMARVEQLKHLLADPDLLKSEAFTREIAISKLNDLNSVNRDVGGMLELDYNKLNSASKGMLNPSNIKMTREMLTRLETTITSQVWGPEETEKVGLMRTGLTAAIAKSISEYKY